MRYRRLDCLSKSLLPSTYFGFNANGSACDGAFPSKLPRKRIKWAPGRWIGNNLTTIEGKLSPQLHSISPERLRDGVSGPTGENTGEEEKVLGFRGGEVHMVKYLVTTEINHSSIPTPIVADGTSDTSSDKGSQLIALCMVRATGNMMNNYLIAGSCLLVGLVLWQVSLSRFR